MTTVANYLGKFFLNQAQFATLCEVDEADIDRLITALCIPAPSYIVSANSTIHSFVFGELPSPHAIPGRYFHPANKIWLERAQKLETEVGMVATPELLKTRFKHNFILALKELDTKVWRLPDCFDAEGQELASGLERRAQSAWEHFLHGTFGLCVANPISEAHIARKEILQEKLNSLSDQGNKLSFTTDEAHAMLQLIEDYAEASMPFSPAEFELSSRKKLVQDLRLRIQNSQGTDLMN